MSESKDNPGVSRRKVLECMTWAGTGVLWTVSGGVPRSVGIIDGAFAAEPSKLNFLQISDSHVGFDKPANPNVIGTLEEAIVKIKSLPAKPSFMIHTGDITHLSKPAEFDDANGAISKAGLNVHYVPGEHDLLDEDAKLYREHYGKNAKGAGWYSFDANGVHFIVRAVSSLHRHLQRGTWRQFLLGNCDPYLHRLAVSQRRLHGPSGDADHHGPASPAHAE